MWLTIIGDQQEIMIQIPCIEKMIIAKVLKWNKRRWRFKSHKFFKESRYIPHLKTIHCHNNSKQKRKGIEEHK